jgi:hypothetical protein
MTLATLGETVEEHKVMEKILHFVPPWLKQIVLTTLLDVEFLTVANLAGRLRAAEEAFAEPPSALQQDGKLYLTEEEWDARCVRREVENLGAGDSSSSSGPSDKGGRGDRGCGRGCEGRPMSAVSVGCWAIGPMNVGPRPKRTRPTQSKKKKPPSWC